MKIRRFQSAQWLPAPPEAVWTFFTDVRNLARLTPPSAGFVVDPGEGPVRPGQMLVHTMRLIPGLPLPRTTWVTEITAVDEPREFVDAAPQSPFAFWRHRHRFLPERGGTQVLDDILWALPLDPFSRIAAPLVARQLASLFAYRRERLASLFPNTAEA